MICTFSSSSPYLLKSITLTFIKKCLSNFWNSFLRLEKRREKKLHLYLRWRTSQDLNEIWSKFLLSENSNKTRNAYGIFKQVYWNATKVTFDFQTINFTWVLPGLKHQWQSWLVPSSKPMISYSISNGIYSICS